jgi:hypothetical protein
VYFRYTLYFSTNEIEESKTEIRVELRGKGKFVRQQKIDSSIDLGRGVNDVFEIQIC